MIPAGERGSKSTRFVTVYSDDERVPEYERAECRWHIIDTLTGAWIGSDGGEPEDQLLVRDWSWVAHALNSVAAEVEQVERQGSAARAMLDEALKATAPTDNRKASADGRELKNLRRRIRGVREERDHHRETLRRVARWRIDDQVARETLKLMLRERAPWLFDAEPEAV